VEVRIGVKGAPRELSLESAQSPEEVQKAVDKALSSGTGSLVLADEKGRRVIVSVAQLAYVEIAESDSRRVGFAAI
jgi:hypothetical protein